MPDSPAPENAPEGDLREDESITSLRPPLLTSRQQSSINRRMAFSVCAGGFLSALLVNPGGSQLDGSPDKPPEHVHFESRRDFRQQVERAVSKAQKQLEILPGADRMINKILERKRGRDLIDHLYETINTDRDEQITDSEIAGAVRMVRGLQIAGIDGAVYTCVPERFELVDGHNFSPRLERFLQNHWCLINAGVRVAQFFGQEVALASR